jgi:hypothetical protein
VAREPRAGLVGQGAALQFHEQIKIIKLFYFQNTENIILQKNIT